MTNFMPVATKPEEKKEKNPPYLRKKGTNTVFAFSPILAEREDMEAWFSVNSVDGTKGPDLTANKMPAIVAAISKLNPEKDFRKDTKDPKAPSLTREVGFDVTADERDEAWLTYLQKKDK